MPKVIVSFTSYPERILTIDKILDSIIKQTRLPDKIVLYLSSGEFENDHDFSRLKKYERYGFEIHWYKENLKSHKKWFYAFQEYPDDIIITIDDDILYQNTMVETLLKYHERFPGAVVARNAKLITCNEEGEPAPYEKWCCWCNEYIETPRMDFIAIGNGGILYPEHFGSHAELYCKDKFMEICPYADDIWLKIMEAYREIPVVLAEKFFSDKVMQEHQKSCLYEDHNKNGGNDRQLRTVLNEYPYTYKKENLVDCIFSTGRISCKEAEAIRDKEMYEVIAELRARFKDYGELLVYGAGELGSRIYYLLEESAAEVIKAFVVNQLADNENMIENIPVQNYRNYIGSNEKIVIALLNNDTGEEVYSELVQKGICADRIIMLRSFEKRALMEKIRIPFNSRKYWNKRYLRGGNSGAGSYGHLADFKAKVINEFVKENGIREVIEWGCGDGNQLKLAEYPIYTGYDVSQKSINMCRRLFADDDTKKFFCCEDEHFKEFFKGDLAISLDVIYHLIEDEVYEQYMKRLFSSSKKYVCIYSSNYEEPAIAHVKHRKFTDWIDKNEKGKWQLMRVIHNRYPYSESRPDDTSWSDFYFYQIMC